jgi:hypothetical protein
LSGPGRPDLCIRGMGWTAERRGGRITASVPTGKWMQGELTYPISAADFDRLRDDPAAFNEIHKSCNEVRGPGWTAQRDDSCIVYLDKSRFEDNRRFRIPNHAFEQLRDDPAAFDEVYRAYRTDYI